jgi:small neutral amino acid transporter SnatA (MarC family)
MIVLGRAVLSLALLGVFVFGVAAPPEHCPSVTAPELKRSAQASVDWFVRNQRPDGSWLYQYNADTDVTAAEYNPVRHAGATMGLYQAAAAGLPGALRSADRGTEWALERLLERDGWAAVAAQPNVDTGATALLVAGLTIRRGDTGDRRYDDVMRRLGRFLLAQTQPSGAVLESFDAVRERPVPGVYSKYFTGEAYWALARLERTFPGEGWGAAAERIGAYLATSRDQAEGHWPPVPDHWAAYGMAETVELSRRGGPPLSEDEVAYARRQTELFGVQGRWLAQRYGPWGGLVRLGDESRGGWYGVIGEALTNWWLAARLEPGLADLRGALGERATCIAGLAMRTQSDAADAASATRPGRVEGAWFRGGETRMDDQQHALAGLLGTIPIAQASVSGSGTSSGDDDAPSAWLWAAALLLGLNPARAAFGIPRASRPSPVVLAAVGGALGGLAVCVGAAAGEPLLDGLDVSEPSFRLAAGVVAAVVAVLDLFRRPPSPVPALAGWRAALIPVAIPLVARPALLVMALGAGADQGVLVCAGAMATGTAALAALAAWCPTEGPGGRALLWAARLLAAGLLACGVVLAVDGVLDV